MRRGPSSTEADAHESYRSIYMAAMACAIASCAWLGCWVLPGWYQVWPVAKPHLCLC